MLIRPADQGDLAALLALAQEVDDTRVLSLESLEHQRRTRPERARVLELVAEDEGRVVATGVAGLNIETTTPGAAWASVAVTADRRHEGIGSALGDRLIAHLTSLGATKATTFLRQTDEGERWAAARGWSRVILGPLVAVDPRTVPAPELPEGFLCLPMSEVRAEDVYDAVCEAALDEPSAIPVDAMAFDEFLRDWEDPALDRSASAAVVADGRVAAFAFMRIAGDRAQHGFTGTARSFRGQGLATAAKRFALRETAARGATRVTTSNAEENAAMRAINRKLGFEPIGAHVILARDL